MRTTRWLVLGAVALQLTAATDSLHAQSSAPAAALPSVKLPRALDRVLRDYERGWRARDAAALAALFAKNGFVMQNREVYDSFGRRSVIPVRTYQERKGFILQPRFVFIDGRTGAVIYSETFHEEILYNAQQSVPALSTYFELMDRVMPSFLSTLSAQKIRGTRVLLK